MKKHFFLCFIIAFSIAISYSAMAEEKIKIALLPWKVNAAEGAGYLKSAMNDMLASRFGNEPLIEIIKEGSLKSALSQYGKEDITEDAARDIGKEVDADYVLYGSITVVAESLSIDARTLAVKKAAPPIFFTSQGRKLENLITIVDDLARDTKDKLLNRGAAAPEAVSQSKAPEYTGKFAPKEKPVETLKPQEDTFINAEKFSVKGVWKSPFLATPMKQFDIGDVDGDGKNEIVMIDNHDLFIYRLEGQTLKLIKEFKGGLAMRDYSVAIADINKNGVPEIYVTRMSHGRLDSSVLEYQDKDFKTIASNVTWFMRVLKEPNTGLSLIGQRYHDTEGFAGSVNQLQWKDGKLQESSLLDLPKGLNLYNFGMADLDKNGAMDIIAFDERDYLRVYNKDKNGSWKEVWKSVEFYGGSLNRIELAASSNLGEPIGIMEIKARILSVDLDGDGIEEVIVARNDPGTFGRYLKMVRSYDNAEMVDLLWEEYSLIENWKTKKTDGYIADYAVADIDNDGQKELVIVVVTSGGTGKSYIMAYSLKNLRKANEAD